MHNSPAKQEKENDTTPENPLVLLRPSLHLPNRISAYTESIGHTIQSPLGPLQHFPLLT